MIVKELIEMMQIDSTSGRERELAKYIINNFDLPGAKLEQQELEDGGINLFYRWGEPKIIFCTHLDTVPPYIKPTLKGETLFGRGACDAKGQIVTFIALCRDLYKMGESNFGLLLLCGEEVGSKGAKVANTLIEGSKFVVIGEPTENKIISAAKGIQLYDIKVSGVSCHSGYPQFGKSAIERALSFFNTLSKVKFPFDNSLGATTYNIGELSSQNPYNVLSDSLTCKLYFRTTFSSFSMIESTLMQIAGEDVCVSKIREDLPLSFHIVEGLPTDVVAFGSDAPALNNLGLPLLYGPGSIRVAHTEQEYIKISDIERAIEDLKKIYLTLK